MVLRSPVFSSLVLSLFVSLLCFGALVIFRKSKLVKLLVFSVHSVSKTLCDQFIEGHDFTTFLSTILVFIGVLNLIGCLGFFPINSFYFFPLLLSGLIFVIGIAIGLFRKGLYLFSDLVSMVPGAMKPVIFPIEFITFMLKPVSMCVRLFLNVFVGHMVIHSLQSIAQSFSFSFIFIPVLVAINLLEIFTGILQAYIFTIFCAFVLGSCINKSH